MNHYRKITAVTALLVLCLTSKIFATGAGVQLSGNPGLFINEETVKLEKLTGKAVGTIKTENVGGNHGDACINAAPSIAGVIGK